MARSGRSSQSPPVDAVPALDGNLWARAYRKAVNGQELTQAERNALNRHEREREEKLRWQYYRSIPQKHWRAMSGRQTKVINEQAARYGIPFGGAKVDLPAVVKAFHNFLAYNAAKLARDDDAMLQGGSSPALESYRQERAKLAKLERLERERQLLPRGDVKQALGRVAAIIRGSGETYQRQFGAEAAEILFDALDDAEREIDRFFEEQREPYDDDDPSDTD